MNNGLSSFNGVFLLHSAQRLAGTLWMTGLVGCGLVVGSASGLLIGTLPVQAQSQAQNQAQNDDDLPALSPSQNSPQNPEINRLDLPAAAPPLQNRDRTQADFFTPTINPQTNTGIPRQLNTPGTQTTPANLSDSFDGYHLGPGDAIFVSVQRYPDLSLQATLDLRGNVVLPIEGAVSLQGLTLLEARNKIRQIYSRYVTFEGSDRDVSLTLVAQRGVQVTILGAVQRPGFYPLTDPTVATALLTAGGASRTSDLRSIQIQRRIPQGTGFAEARVDVDLFTPLKEGSALPEVRLENGDVMIVPELEPGQISNYDRNLVARSTLAQPVINVRFLNYAGGRGGIGTLNVNNGSTFLDALSLLGVDPDAAKLKDIALIRYDPETGRAVTVSIDAKMAIRGDITQNPPLEDSDVIVVGRNLVGRITFALQSITRPFRNVLDFTNFFNNSSDNSFFN